MTTTATEATAITAPAKTAKQWAREINAAHGKGIEACIEMARLLAAARDDLEPSGKINWEDFVKNELNINPADARKLEAIARNAWLTKRSNLNALPSAVSTLYELSRGTDEQLEAAKKENKLHPKITADNARKIIGHRPIPRGTPGKARTIDNDTGKDVEDGGKSDGAVKVVDMQRVFDEPQPKKLKPGKGGGKPTASNGAPTNKLMGDTDACVTFIKSIGNPQERKIVLRAIIEQTGFKIVGGELERVEPCGTLH
jgi:hypothetical protein